ncbi:UvrD-helicase domain-containing protein [Nonlabens ponticola]|uniref:ATP-dependent helicase n=1 Tax=Nonlabens ponticola TaxID=2496866 RepID=A0A3S9N0J4_9FLAO|nr:UvrD-helicase domain-containing protein [Nonlabens ponticola]AZQ44842.1 ATP-dependent helicase [Nonlabens ponticola]
MINIREEDINYAEEILLKNGRSFDEERTDFIKNLTTIDLQAVPGSGKTTALLAKLLILEKKLPLFDNKGILVISHTNAAVDEIKDRIGHLCPKLFSHPNFVGTIQSFVDTFLAIPAYLLKYKQKPARIDNDIYNETILKFFNYGKEGFSRQEKNNAIYYNNVFNVLYNYRFQKSKSGYVMVHKMNGKLLEVKTPNPRRVKFTPFEIERITEWLKITKEKTLETGMLCYDDAYFLADVLLDEIKDYDRLIQQRFQYVFVDEMQDMELHQISLIEKLFTGHSCTSKLQRLGDLNQCIFSGDISTEKIWNQRLDKLFFKGSHRLSPRVASIVQNLSSTPTEVEGRGNNDDDSVIDIKPIMYVFEVTEAHQVIPRFSKTISEYQEKGYLPISTQNYHAFGWRKETDKDHKLCLNTYLPSLKSNTSKSKLEFETLEDYLLYLPKHNGSLKTGRSAILSCLTKVFRLENLKDEHNRYMTPYRLIHTIKKMHLNEYDGFKNKIYNWSIYLAESNINDTLAEIRDFIPNLLSWFGSEINNSNTFITTPSVHKDEEELNEFKNYYDHDGFQIKVGTVHNIKGQTHTASLYLETFWNGKYESERVKDQFFGVPIDVSSKGLTVAATAKLNQTLKMMYVGFSRPTHLLAFAVEKSRFDKNLKEIDRNIWDVIEIKKNDKAEDS